MRAHWVLLLVLALMWPTAFTRADVCSIPVSEPGADICPAGGWPTNFVPHAAFATADKSSCGGPAFTTAIGYSGTFNSATVLSTAPVMTGDTINISFVGWAGGSTGTVAIRTEVSPDNTTFYPCEVAPGRNFAGNNTADTFTCASPFDSAQLYVKFSTTTVSSAAIFPRSLEIETCVPPKTLSVATSLTFGATLVGTTSDPQPLTLTNSGVGSIDVSSISIFGEHASDFVLDAGTCGSLTPTVTEAGACDLSLAFQPQAASDEPVTAILRLVSNSDAGVNEVVLSGSAVTPQSIPTLSEWGMIAMFGLLASTMLVAMRRRSPRASG